MLSLLAACYTLDDVPVVEGYKCAPDNYALVLDVLDGDTIEVLLAEPLPNDAGSSSSGQDTGTFEAAYLDEGTDSGSDSGVGGFDDDEYTATVRLLGVDAPEIAHSDGEVSDCFGDTSADFLSDALIGETIILSRDVECQDVYGRELAYVALAAGDDEWDFECEYEDDETSCNTTSSAQVLMNDIVIRYGYARVYEDFDNIRLASLLYESQDAAQAANAGLWAECE